MHETFTFSKHYWSVMAIILKFQPWVFQRNYKLFHVHISDSYYHTTCSCGMPGHSQRIYSIWCKILTPKRASVKLHFKQLCLMQMINCVKKDGLKQKTFRNFQNLWSFVFQKDVLFFQTTIRTLFCHHVLTLTISYEGRFLRNKLRREMKLMYMSSCMSMTSLSEFFSFCTCIANFVTTSRLSKSY